jgi:hypothetical protein
MSLLWIVKLTETIRLGKNGRTNTDTTQAKMCLALRGIRLMIGIEEFRHHFIFG